MRSQQRRALLCWGLLVGLVFGFSPSLGGDAAASLSVIIDGAGAKAAPLSVEEEADPFALELARRFNPAMALPAGDGPWPVAVSYTWADGADLLSRSVDQSGAEVARAVAARNQDLRAGADWGALPPRDPQGRALEYFIDAPGDDALEAGAAGGTAWRRRWGVLAGSDPARSRFPPTQYAHLFWLDRGRGLLAIQYWFFFPFNEWINHHEGDWEHVNIVVEGASSFAPGATFRMIAQQFFFHGWRHEPARVLRVAGDHVVVFTGGRGRLLWWTGTQSGGSYPLPARYPGAGGAFGPLSVDDDTREPGRFLGPEAFRVVLLPEPARLDTRAHPELSWLRLRFFAGQPRMLNNPPLVDWAGGGKPPLQPGVRRDWNSTISRPRWPGAATLNGAADAGLPKEWHAAR
jgi:hypothetical protein